MSSHLQSSICRRFSVICLPFSVRLGVLKSAQPYVNITRLRNVIVHQYEEIDPVILFDLAKNRLNDLRKFRDEIDALE